MVYTADYNSLLGKITLASDGTALTGLWIEGQTHSGTLDENSRREDLPVFGTTKKWLDIYFGGKIPDFTPPIKLCGTDFRRAVWEILLTIPYGKTVTYGDIARIIAGQRGIARMSAQAVGGAVGHNPVSIIVPCHRVIGSDGSLTGYDGGLDKKTKLLKIEGIV